MLLPLHVGELIFFARLASCTYAEIKCHSESCEASSDDISLIQGLLEPDLVAKFTVRDSEIAEKSPELQLSKMSHVGAGGASTTNLTTTTTLRKVAVKGTKVKLNAAGDLPAFLSAIRFNMMLLAFFVVCFLFLQWWYPKVYAYRWNNGKPNTPPDLQEQGWFVWVVKSWRVQLLKDLAKEKDDPGNEANKETVEATSGLDAAMLLVFIEFALELMLVMGIPACLLGIPVYAFAGGGFAKADRLSWAGIGNVIFNNTFETGKPMLVADEERLDEKQWIYWTVACMVWVVVIWVQYRVFCKQRLFIHHRMDWLQNMEEPRSTTVLVQGIEPEICSAKEPDDELKRFFEKMFGEDVSEKIRNAFVIRNTKSLRDLIKVYVKDAEDRRLAEESDIGTADEKAKTKEVLAQDLENIKLKQKEIADDAEEKYTTTSGFVTFKDRRDAQRALGINLSEDEDTWVLSTPPAPSDVQYHDFEIGETTAETWQLMGYAAVAGLFFAFMPIVIGISNISLAIARTPLIENMLKATGFLATAKGMLQSVGLTIMMSMLPTFLSWIFQIFYTLKAARWAQLEIQTYYFWFLVLFVLLTTSIGTDLSATISKIAESPLRIFNILASKMPFTTHFYLNYVMLQPVTHGMNLTRYMNIIKYRAMVSYFGTDEEPKVKQYSEPEDQDYYGMGSRSARMALMLIIGVVFGTICPLMHVVVFWNFIVARTIYGYLIPFVEDKKDDMGGAHWCKQLVHLQLGVLIYIVMMTGILLERANSMIPAVISAISFLWWFLSFRKFSRALHWEKLPYRQVIEYDLKASKAVRGQKYEQLDLKWNPGDTEGSFSEALMSSAHALQYDAQLVTKRASGRNLF